MSAPNPLQRLKLGQFADRFRSEMIPLGNRFCYFAAAVPLGPEELKEYLDEPVAALPPVIAGRLPEIRILLVPYLEMGEAGKSTGAGEPVVSTEKPKDARALLSGTVMLGADAVLGFAVKETEVADYHYRFYRAIAEIVAGEDGKAVPPAYLDLLREELEKNVHGEVDEPSWTLKLELDDADRKRGKRVSKRVRAYQRQSFVDLLTLYLHGICCDIDVETGPKRLASHLLRKRLRLLREIFPPPQGYAVLPEDL